MGIITVQLPDSLHEQVQQLADRDQVTVNQLITIILAEKLAAQLTEEYLLERAHNGNESQFEESLTKDAQHPSAYHDRV